MKKNKKEIQIPISWEQITLRDYQKLQEYYHTLENNDDIDLIMVLSILTNTDADDIRLMPNDVIQPMLNDLSFLNTPPPNEPRGNIEYNNEVYYIKQMEDLTFGEWTDANQALKNDKNDYASVLAVLCRKQDEEYNQEYINHKYNDRRNMFLDNIPFTEIYGLIFFLIASLSKSAVLFQHYMTLKEELNQYVKNIESSVRNGAVKKPFTFLQMRKLQKLKKSLSKI